MANWFKHVIKDKRLYYVLFCGVVVGLLAHGYGLVNVIQNHDSWGGITSYGSGIQSGRWGLALIGELVDKTFGVINLPFLNGMIAIFFLIISSYLIIRIFDIKKPLYCGVFTAIMVAFPVVTSTMLFTFTVNFYSFAVFLAVLSVYLTRTKIKYNIVLSILLASLAIGIYQGYFPLIITLYVTLLIVDALRLKKDFKEIFMTGLKYLGILLASLAVYFVIMKLSILIFDVKLTDYQGINSMGKITIKSFLFEFVRSIGDFVLMPFLPEYSFSTSVANNIFLRIIFIMLEVSSIIYLIYFMVINKKEVFKKQKGILLVLFMIYPVAVNSITLMCPNSFIHNLMIFAWVLVYLLPFIFIENLKIQKVKYKKVYCNISLVFISIMLFGYIRGANVNYTIQKNSNSYAINYWNSVITSVKNTPGFNTSLKWAFIGEKIDSMYLNVWSENEKYGLTNDNMINIYSYKNFIGEALGYNIPYATDEEILSLMESKDIKEMKTYPNYGSILIYNDYVVVKFSDGLGD